MFIHGFDTLSFRTSFWGGVLHKLIYHDIKGVHL